jgi:predicted double-glycine peptidase
MIVPINLYGYNHSLVFRGALGTRVLLADPSLRSRTLAIETFLDAWIEYRSLATSASWSSVATAWRRQTSWRRSRAAS